MKMYMIARFLSRETKYDCCVYDILSRSSSSSSHCTFIENSFFFFLLDTSVCELNCLIETNISRYSACLSCVHTFLLTHVSYMKSVKQCELLDFQ